MSPGLQTSLFGVADPALNPSTRAERIQLDATAWVDVTRDWLLGADVVLERVMAAVPWRQGRRRMWDRVVDDPRLSYWARTEDAPVDPIIPVLQRALEAKYRHRFRRPGFNYYRDGRDSVAWHADRELRALDDTLVAIVTLGTRRPFLIRPVGGGSSQDLRPGSGDLIVMGGSAQRGWEHAVPKTARSGPRVSVSWRWTLGVPHATDLPDP
ncbi:MAG: alpha-ketoglutarate-dependent dioxygenase AlkB [Acidimicrobiia bacterium]|nr:alpha-ketoglutarate-dependent dioxygenase AlkB [Acidimicrobiia bacterium]